MSYCITFAAARDVLGAHQNSMTHWTRGLPRRRGTGSNGVHHLRFDDLVVALRGKRREGLRGDDLQRVMDLVPDEAPTEALEDADARSTALVGSLTQDERQRFNRSTMWMARCSNHSMWQQTHLFDRPAALARMILRPCIADFALTGRFRESYPKTIEDGGDFFKKHVHANASPEEKTNLAAKQTLQEKQIV